MKKTFFSPEQYILSTDDIKQLQAVMLELLVEFDRICRKNNIIYSIDGGTLLGAVRHKGFIPWDDDCDVIMVRSQYEKFRTVCKEELDHDKFYFQDLKATRGYRWGYGKLRRKGTKFVRLHQEHMPYAQGIFLDIFVCDNVPENYFLRCLCNFKSYLYRKIFWAKAGKEDSTGLKKVCFQILAMIPEDKLKRNYFQYVQKCNRTPSKWVKCLTFPACNKTYGYKREWYEDTVDIPFENVVLKGCRKSDEYLRFLYGDYMVLPPIEKRKVHPISKFQLPFNAEDNKNE